MFLFLIVCVCFSPCLDFNPLYLQYDRVYLIPLFKKKRNKEEEEK